MSLFDIKFRAEAFKKSAALASIPTAKDHIQQLRTLMDKYRSSSKPNFEAKEWILAEETLQYYEEIKDVLDLTVQLKKFFDEYSFFNRERLESKIENIEKNPISISYLDNYKSKATSALNLWNDDFAKCTFYEKYKDAMKCHEVLQSFVDHYDEYFAISKAKDLGRSFANQLRYKVKDMDDWLQRKAPVRIKQTWEEIEKIMNEINTSPYAEQIKKTTDMAPYMDKYKSYFKILVEDGAIEGFDLADQAKSIKDFLGMKLNIYRNYVKDYRASNYRDDLQEAIDQYKSEKPKVMEHEVLKPLLDEFEELKKIQYENDINVWKNSKISKFRNGMQDLINEYRDFQRKEETSYLIDRCIEQGENFMNENGGREILYWEGDSGVFLDFQNDTEYGCKELIDEWNEIVANHDNYKFEIDTAKRKANISLEEKEAVNDLERAMQLSKNITSKIMFADIENPLNRAKEKAMSLEECDLLNDLIQKCEDEVIPMVYDQIKWNEEKDNLMETIVKVERHLHNDNVEDARSELENARYMAEDLKSLNCDAAKEQLPSILQDIEQLENRINDIENIQRQKRNGSLSEPEPAPAPTPAPSQPSPKPEPAPAPTSAPEPKQDAPAQAQAPAQDAKPAAPKAKIIRTAPPDVWQPCTVFTVPIPLMNKLPPKSQYALKTWLKDAEYFNKIAFEIDKYVQSLIDKKVKSSLSKQVSFEWKRDAPYKIDRACRDFVPLIDCNECKEILANEVPYEELCSDVRCKFGSQLIRLIKDYEQLEEYERLGKRGNYVKIVNNLSRGFGVFSALQDKLQEEIEKYDIFDVPPWPRLNEILQGQQSCACRIFGKGKDFEFFIDGFSTSDTFSLHTGYELYFTLNKVIQYIRSDENRFSSFTRLKPLFEGYIEKISAAGLRIFKIWFDNFQNYSIIKPEKQSLNSFLAFTKHIQKFPKEYHEKLFELEKKIKEIAAENNVKIQKLIDEYYQKLERDYQERLKVIKEQIIQPMIEGGTVTISNEEYSFEVNPDEYSIILRSESGSGIYKITYYDRSTDDFMNIGFDCGSNKDQNNYQSHLYPFGLYAKMIKERPTIRYGDEIYGKDLLKLKAIMVTVKLPVEDVNYNNVKIVKGNMHNLIRALISAHESYRNQINEESLRLQFEEERREEQERLKRERREEQERFMNFIRYG
ncbi:hypothetical protein GPJ56_003373 [Histomonas meleagridis]|uniref:uncharacterized protein n=1 Tax=Histomonas meleagridis TaxID=135588 RepID=UPI003559966A|nr:hypothetical protein GPJ56_003373 [Histomonas meleagridis]KAH0804992.1 hypothetical protein GO595_001937 [Histomonas meleagridis]